MRWRLTSTVDRLTNRIITYYVMNLCHTYFLLRKVFLLVRVRLFCDKAYRLIRCEAKRLNRAAEILCSWKCMYRYRFNSCCAAQPVGSNIYSYWLRCVCSDEVQMNLVTMDPVLGLRILATYLAAGMRSPIERGEARGSSPN